jgi:hypothetical protein
VDGTGLKLCGPGEWLTEKHGARRRRAWKSLHPATDADTGRIVAPVLTDKDADDGSQVGPLPDPNKRCPSACRAPPRDENGATSDGRFWLTLRPADAWRPAVAGGIDPAHEIGL